MGTTTCAVVRQRGIEMRYKDLPQQTGLGVPPQVKALIMGCDECGTEWSANQGDYFTRCPENEVLCEICESPLKLFRKATMAIECNPDGTEVETCE
jgi:hypothetical protein